MLTGEAEITNFIVFGLPWSWIHPTILYTRGTDDCKTDLYDHKSRSYMSGIEYWYAYVVCMIKTHVALNRHNRHQYSLSWLRIMHKIARGGKQDNHYTAIFLSRSQAKICIFGLICIDHQKLFLSSLSIFYIYFYIWFQQYLISHQWFT